MQPEEFLRRLKELAEITNLDEGKLDTKKQNDYPKQVKRIRHQARLCDLDCGRVVTDQHVDLQCRLDLGTWLKHCRTCGKFQNPITKEFTTLHDINHYYKQFLTERNK